ncbi:MAG: recombinase family protein [Phormidium tanganyikae FI6-MK23]|jgi:DNA invertase Pin-like site-specific DNA recombinase|nr:recombinase family protein [Phormidium tanganyikae FI6-MK23]
MKIGYARVSTIDQSLDLQLDALNKYGCEKIHQDEGISGSKSDRPQLNAALADLRPGDTLVVWKLDRLGRSIDHLRSTVFDLQKRGIEFVSIQDAIDTTTAMGRLFFNIMASMAEFEKDLIRERTLAGLAAARARGRSGGRPKKVTEAQIKRARELAKNPGITIVEICKIIGVPRSTYYREVAPNI